MSEADIVRRLATVPLTESDFVERPELPLLVQAAREHQPAAEERPWTVEEILQREG